MIFKRTNDAEVASAPLPPPKRPATVPVPSDNSVIGPDLVVIGSLASKRDIQIDGSVDGDVRCARLEVGSSGKITGNIFASDATIRGTLKGNIWANKVLLGSGSRVDGDVVNKTFGVESGAIFEGSSRQSDDPVADATKGDKKKSS